MRNWPTCPIRLLYQAVLSDALSSWALARRKRQERSVGQLTASSEPARLLRFAPFQGFIWEMSDRMRSRSVVWRELHLSLERLYSDYLRHGRDMAIPVFSRAIDFSFSRDTVEAEAAKRRLPIDLTADWPEFERLRAAKFDEPNLGTADLPFESVYQAACFFRKLLMLYPREDDYWFYRGQRDDRWDCVPSIMRALRKMPPDRREAALAAGLRKVRSIVPGSGKPDLRIAI